MSSKECLFCKIINKDIPASIVYEDDLLIAIEDIYPVTPKHILLIPKEHISSLNETKETHADILGHIQIKAAEIARQESIAEKGFRLVNNCGEWGGQTINHIHYHLLGGLEMGWPPFKP